MYVWSPTDTADVTFRYALVVVNWLRSKRTKRTAGEWCV